MGITNEETTTRAEEKECDVHTNAGRNRDVGGEGGRSRYQQKRTDRANSSKSTFFRSGKTITGGMLRQLITDYCDQVAAKKREIQRHQDAIKNLEDEAVRLQSRINEFQSLQEELEQQIKENP